MRKRLIICAMLLTAAILLNSCGASVPVVIEQGASHFAEGKDEEDYGKWGLDKNDLDDLINKYSGSYHNTSGSPMSPSQYDDIREKTEDDPQIVSSDVGSIEDLTRLMLQEYRKLSETVVFMPVNGFDPDIPNNLNDISREIKRRDPINGTGVESWTWWIDTATGEYTVQINYSFDTAELRRMRAETEIKADEAAQQIYRPNMSEYDLVLAVNDYLCGSVYYSTDDPYPPVTHTAYGALIDGCAVCDGYSCAAKAIFDRLGVECDFVIGVCTNGGGHAWNLVKIEGNWYQLDITWNDCISGYDFFLVTDDYMKDSRTWDYAVYPATPAKAYKDT